MNTLKTNFLLIIVALIPYFAVAQKIKLIPVNHTNKWFNGSEWAISEQSDVKLKLLYDTFKGGKYLFKLSIFNNSSKDINIDPNLIYYKTIEFEKEKILNSRKKSTRGNTQKVSDKDFINKIINDNDTIYVEKADKLLKNIKFLSTLGFLFDSDNLAITRGYSKMDYYKQNLLLKNTIEPNKKFEKLLIIDGSNYNKIIDLIIPIENDIFKFQFEMVE